MLGITKRLLSRSVLERSARVCLSRHFSSVQSDPKDDPKATAGRLKIKQQGKERDAQRKRDLIESEALNKIDQEKAIEYASASQKKAMLVTKVGAAANLALAVSKGTIGYAISSTGLIADAANSLGDLLSDAVVYYSVQEARKMATPDRPWGRGKIEPLGALSVGVLLLATGFGIGYTAILAIIEAAAISHMVSPHVVELVQGGDYAQLLNDVVGGATSSVSSSPPIPSASEVPICGTPPAGTVVEDGAESVPKLVPLMNPEINALHNYAGLAVSALSIVVKELLFRYTLKAGKEAHSDAVIANAWQHRADVSTSAAVFVGLTGSMAGVPILDPLAGLLVAGLIVQQGGISVMNSLKDLSDAPASAKETEKLKQTCLSVSGVMSVETIRARKSGPYLYVEATIDVDGSISASAAHRIAELTRLELLRRHSPRVGNAVVDMNPLGSSGLGENSPHWARDHVFIVDEVKRAAMEVDEVMSVSEVQVYYKDSGGIACKVDIVLPPSLTIKQAHSIAVKTRAAIEAVLPGMVDIDVDLELDETDIKPK
mmetsp:Transcript_60292/g.118599  ORF Transcript_60292/g.118599 Transcript_60292/m.118599 type:complete len:544 (+) Transcript_60292:56-1687(+)